MSVPIVSPRMRERAAALAEQASTWLIGRSKQDGTPFWIIPSVDGHSAHWANIHGCTCIGHRHRGVCSHQLACQLLQRQSDAAIAATHVFATKTAV
jgi:hypothetical protein